MTFSPYALLCRSASCPERYISVLFSTSKRVCMLFWSSSASSCSFSHMVACSSASSASSFSSSVRLWLFMNFAMLSAVCCCYSAAWLFDWHFCQTTLSLPKNSSALLVIRTCRQDRMCNCYTAHTCTLLQLPWSGLRPDTPCQIRSHVL